MILTTFFISNLNGRASLNATPCLILINLYQSFHYKIISLYIIWYILYSSYHPLCLDVIVPTLRGHLLNFSVVGRSMKYVIIA